MEMITLQVSKKKVIWMKLN